MEKWHWSSLADKIINGQCTLVLGPEIPVKWRSSDTDIEVDTDKIITDALAEYIFKHCQKDKDIDSSVDSTLFAVAQEFDDDQRFQGALKTTAGDFYNSIKFLPSYVDNVFATIPFDFIITTRHDNYFSNLHQNIRNTPITKYFNYKGTSEENAVNSIWCSDKEPFIYSLFGHKDQPQSLVINENDLLEFLVETVSNRTPLPDSILSELKERECILFIGFGIKQWYMRVILKILIRAFDINIEGTAIITEPLNELSKKDKNQTILFYQRSPRFTVADTDLNSFLNTLSESIKKKGGYKGSQKLMPSPRVFLSYASEDVAIAKRIHNSFSESNFQLWFDKERLEPGFNWNEKIESAIKDSNYILIIYSTALVEKKDSYVNKEITLAVDRAMQKRGICIIPILISKIQVNQRIKLLEKFQEAEVKINNFEKDIKKLKSQLMRDFQR